MPAAGGGVRASAEAASDPACETVEVVTVMVEAPTMSDSLAAVVIMDVVMPPRALATMKSGT